MIVERETIRKAVKAAEQKWPHADLLDVAEAVSRVTGADVDSVLEVVIQDYVDHVQHQAAGAAA